MRNIVAPILVLFLSLMLVKPQSARAEMPVKARALLTIVGYGTAGGALLGAASMAFGTSTRAVAQGASLGLYAGIIFGTYILVTHHNKRYGSYDDKNSPYQDSRDIYGDDYDADEGGDADGESRGGFFDRIQTMQIKLAPEKQKGVQVPPLYLNLFQYSF